ncbi:hypothetical protein JL721_8901 [Aureococcus anophagefferens]|nr:hypothetical protein JL721_8901 [Aureococcus anophagefferens]
MRLWAGNVVFLEAAEGLRSALRLLGVAARVDVGVEACPWVSDDELWVLVGATLLPGVAPSDAPWPPPRRFVVYQMEQLGSAWLTPAYLALVARADALWEFAPSHAPRAAAARGVAYVPLAPPDLGPAPPPSPAPAADLLFYGCGNARRALRDACAALLAPRAASTSGQEKGDSSSLQRELVFEAHGRIESHGAARARKPHAGMAVAPQVGDMVEFVALIREAEDQASLSECLVRET